MKTGPITWLAAAVVALAGCAIASVPAGSGAVVHGVVLAAPGCPVERVGSPCPARHVAGALVTAASNGVQVAQTRTGVDGSFTLTLPSGTLTITATGPGAYRSSSHQVVQVHDHQPEGVTLTIDSGIR